jgi:hypothetical protein
MNLKLWSGLIKGKKVVIRCDNLAACIVINSGKSRCSFMQSCLREICYLAAVFQFQVKAVHLEGSVNRIADSLSRWHLDGRFASDFAELTKSVEFLEEMVVSENLFDFSNNW